MSKKRETLADIVRNRGGIDDYDKESVDPDSLAGLVLRHSGAIDPPDDVKELARVKVPSPTPRGMPTGVAQWLDAGAQAEPTDLDRARWERLKRLADANLRALAQPSVLDQREQAQRERRQREIAEHKAKFDKRWNL